MLLTPCGGIWKRNSHTPISERTVRINVRINEKWPADYFQRAEPIDCNKSLRKYVDDGNIKSKHTVGVRANQQLVCVCVCARRQCACVWFCKNTWWKYHQTRKALLCGRGLCGCSGEGACRVTSAQIWWMQWESSPKAARNATRGLFGDASRSLFRLASADNRDMADGWPPRLAGTGVAAATFSASVRRYGRLTQSAHGCARIAASLIATRWLRKE